MSIVFATYENHIEQLKLDFHNLNEHLPCDFEPQFIVVKKTNFPDQIASTSYGKEISGILLPPYIEFSTYFQYGVENRKIILLHEIIHACQRKNELFEINQKTREILTNHVNFIANSWKKEKEKSSTPNTIPFEILDQKKDSIRSIFEIPFELCNDLYFREHYPLLFEKNMTLNYANISGYITKFTLFSRIFQKYHMIFKELLRTKYLCNLTTGMSFEQKYRELYDEWYVQYMVHFNNTERNTLDKFIEPFTNLENCSSDKISPNLIQLSDFIWNNSETI